MIYITCTDVENYIKRDIPIIICQVKYGIDQKKKVE